ncbi:MAG: hypothetical protein ACTSP1_17575 [Candidatus Freyarchaeota archaeon]
MSLPYEFIQTNVFTKNLKEFSKPDQKKILMRIRDWLSVKPYKYGMM